MHGLHPEAGIKGVIFAVVLWVLFLGICTILIGKGWTELRKNKNRRENVFLVIVGMALILASTYMAFLFIEN